MQLVRVHQSSDVYYVMPIVGRAVKEGGNVEVKMHLLMSIVIVKVGANVIQKMAARTNAGVKVTLVL